MRLTIVTLLACVCFASAQFPDLASIQQQIVSHAVANAPKVIENLNNLLERIPAGSPFADYVQKMIDQVQALIDQHSSVEARFIKLPQFVINFLENIFGLTGIADQLNALSDNVKDQFFDVLSQLKEVGLSAFGAVAEVTASLVSKLKDHSLVGVDQIVKPAIDQLKEILANAIQNHGNNRAMSSPRFIQSVIDFLENAFGLSSVAQQIKEVAGQVQDQLFSTLIQIGSAGRDAWAKAKVVLAQLVEDLKSHASNGTPFVQSAIDKLKEIVQQSIQGNQNREARFLPASVMEAIFGFTDSMKEQISQVGGAALAQMAQVASQIMFQGTKAWGQLKEAFGEFTQGMSEHVGAGFQDYFNNFMAKLQGILDSLNNKETRSVANNRFIIDFLENIFGLSSIKDTIAEFTGNVQAQFFELLEEVREKGKIAFGQGKEVMAELVENIKDHAGNAAPFVQEAIDQLKEIVAGKQVTRQQQPRFILEWLEDKFGLGDVANVISNLGSSIKENLANVLEDLLFSGQNVIAQATPVLQDLAEKLHGHLIDGGKDIVSSHIDQIKDIIAETAGQINIGKRDLNGDKISALKDKLAAALDKLQNVENPKLQAIIEKLKEKLNL